MSTIMPVSIPYYPQQPLQRPPTVPVVTAYPPAFPAYRQPVQPRHILSEYELLKRRWFPKQPFSTTAPPEEQIAGAGNMAFLAGLLAFALKPLRIAVIPIAAVTYIWQSQRNQDGLNKLYQRRSQSL